MPKYKYVPNLNMWGRYKSVLDIPEWESDIKRFFKLANNPKTNDEIDLKENIKNNQWDLVFHYWQHNFDSPFTPIILAKFLDECKIDFMSSFDNPLLDRNYFLDGEVVKIEN